MKKSGGSKKIGRNKKWCETYQMRGTREINKLKKIRRHLRRHPHDGIGANVDA